MGERIFLFGSSVNPPTKAHAAILSYFDEVIGTDDKLWLLPVYRHMFAKDKDLISFEHRYNMSEAIIKEKQMQKAEVLDLEKKVYLERREEVAEEEKEKFRVYSVDIIEYVQAQNPSAKIHWIMGADTFKDLHKWNNPEKLIEMATLEVIDRDGTLSKEELKANEYGGNANLHCVEIIDFNVSSTNARNATTENELKEHVTDEVAQYIIENNLYSFNNEKESCCSTLAEIFGCVVEAAISS